MESSIGHAVVVNHAAIGYVESGHGSREVLREIFAHGEIESRVTGQILAGVGPAGNALLSVVESGAVVNVSGNIGAPRKVDVAAHVERVALVVVERAEIRLDIGDWVGRAHISVVEASSDHAAGFGNLVRVSEVNLGTVRDARRAQRKFPSPNQRPGVGERKENIRSANIVVIEKIGDVGLEVIDVEDPSAIRDSDAKLMFFVTLASEGEELAGVGSLAAERFELPGNGFDGRRLIVVSVEGAKRPMNLGHCDGGAETRADRGFRDRRLR